MENNVEKVEEVNQEKVEETENKEVVEQPVDVTNEKDNKSETRKSLIQAVKFLLFSISAGIIEIVVFTLLNELLTIPYWPAYLTGLICSVLWNFTLNRKFTFKSANNIPIAMLKVFCFYLVFTPVSTIAGNALEVAGWNEYLVLALTMIVNFVTEFFYSKYFVFKENSK